MNQFSENAARIDLVQQATLLAGSGLDPLGSATVSMRWSRPAADGLLLVSVSDCCAPGSREAACAIGEAADELLVDADDGGLGDLASWHRCDDQRLAGVHGGLYTHRPDAGAVVLMASPYAATLACSRDVQLDGIPFFHPMVAVSGRDRIDCCHPGFYAALAADVPLDVNDDEPFGAETSPLAMLLEALDGGHACLVAHYGLLVLADDPRSAVTRARQLEALCQIYWQVLKLGRPAAMPIVTA